MDGSEREEWVYRAKLAEQAERYDDMVLCVTELVRLQTPLSDEEQAVLNVAFKNHIGRARKTWRVLQAAKSSAAFSPAVTRDFLAQVEAELTGTLSKATVLLNLILPLASAPASLVFLHKSKADNSRYLAEFTSGADRRQAAEEALAQYSAAAALASSELQPDSELRLGVALNRAVFYFEILNRPEDARAILNDALDAVAQLPLSPSSAAVVRLMEDDLRLWQPEQPPQSATV